jgi:hypothetical protein
MRFEFARGLYQMIANEDLSYKIALAPKSLVFAVQTLGVKGMWEGVKFKFGMRSEIS